MAIDKDEQIDQLITRVSQLEKVVDSLITHHVTTRDTGVFIPQNYKEARDSSEYIHNVYRSKFTKKNGY